MSQLAAGKDTLAWCNRCSLILSHIIESMLDSKTVNRVQCKTCLSSHQFKNNPGVKKSALPKAPVRKTSKPSVLQSQERWEKAILKYQQFTPYNIRLQLKVGDPIQHQNFGRGVVEAISSQGRAEILFQDGTKELVYGKT